ncbi:hypothetical protein [Nonomuraea sp. SYSU D8015]|uniref:hypothetical protein n=1 Tax=Nonomuraea sp. SYSU D8015 TaxID=2593644 RepID=UPI001661081E|nr:hypothetical protein [Nonomuraea sp. SYSU D8015]
MASFAHLAYVLERAADIMLGDHTLDPEEALARAVWGGEPCTKEYGPDLDAFYIASRIIELQDRFTSWETTGIDPDATHVRDIPHAQARSAARHMAELFHRIDYAGYRPRVEDDDLDVVARLMWEQAHGVELARCP